MFHKNIFFQKSQKGQTLIIIVVVMILALGIGVTISTRFLKNLRNVVYTDFSSRAMSAAEAGAERFLALPMETLSDYITNNSCGTACHIEVPGADGNTATVDVALSFQGNSTASLPFVLNAQDTFEVSLNGYPSGTTINVCLDNTPISNPLAVHILYLTGTSGSYNADTYILETFGCKTLPAKNNPIALRIRSVYDKIPGSVVPYVNTSLPSQGVVIQSTGNIQDVTKKVTVIKSYAFLPTDFDFVLFSKSDTEPLSN